jgi:hypothetical protein
MVRIHHLPPSFFQDGNPVLSRKIGQIIDIRGFGGCAKWLGTAWFDFSVSRFRNQSQINHKSNQAGTLIFQGSGLFHGFCSESKSVHKAYKPNQCAVRYFTVNWEYRVRGYEGSGRGGSLAFPLTQIPS